MPRLIAHLDMDAFYASVELLRYPELRGLPVVIGGGRDHQPRVLADGTRHFFALRDYVGRGVVTTSTYEARKFGVFSAMGMMKSAVLAPDAVLLPVDFDEYRKYSRLFKAAVRSVADVVEDRGIDEIYVDLSEIPGVHDDAGRDAGLRLKAAVREATGLNCSIGITPNKLLSKIASELDKPDGLTLLGVADIAARIWPLAARKVNGIGPKAAEKLAALGIHTIGDVAAADPAFLIARFGKSFGAWLHEASHGRDDRSVVTASEPQSISRETTFDRDLHAVRDRAELGAIFTDLCTKLGGDLARKGYAAKTIGIKLRFDDFKIATRDLTLPAHTLDGREIRRAAGQCLKRVDLARRLRLLGVRASGLEKLSELLAGMPASSRSKPRDAARPAHDGAGLPLFDSATQETSR
jgi:DNA polymerase-4